MTVRNHDWLILRTSGANTLRLAQSLAWADIEAWSPALVFINREGDSRARRKERVAVMPTFVFARAEHLAQLQYLKEALTSPHPDFWFFRRADGEPAEIADRELDPLRVAEQKARPKELLRQWKTGEGVKYPDAGFEGLVGVVEGSQGKFTLVSFPGKMAPLKIKTANLLPHAA